MKRWGESLKNSSVILNKHWNDLTDKKLFRLKHLKTFKGKRHLGMSLTVEYYSEIVTVKM